MYFALQKTERTRFYYLTLIETITKIYNDIFKG